MGVLNFSPKLFSVHLQKVDGSSKKSFFQISQIRSPVPIFWPWLYVSCPKSLRGAVVGDWAALGAGGFGCSCARSTYSQRRHQSNQPARSVVTSNPDQVKNPASSNSSYFKNLSTKYQALQSEEMPSNQPTNRPASAPAASAVVWTSKQQHI